VGREPLDIGQARNFIAENGIRTVIAAGIDQGGILRGKRYTTGYFLDAAAKGFNMPWSLLNTGPMDEAAPGVMETGIPDVKAVPDLSTLRVANWEEKTAVVLMDWRWADGSPCPLCPRSELKRHVAAARAAGFRERFALELEFYVLPLPAEKLRQGAWAEVPVASRDPHCYSIYEGSYLEPLYARLREDFPDAIEGGGPEWGCGQFEINLRAGDALAMADTVALFKTAVKQRAAALGMSATFMAKVHETFSGNSGHIHQSLLDAASGKPLFYDAGAADRMSPLMRHYMAGQLAALIPTTLCFAPYVNSYKRFREDSLAGIMKGWGVDNRTAGLRAITASEGSCRVEHRIGGADLNPYVAFSALLGAGLKGVADKTPLPPPLAGNAYHIADVERVPRSLSEAVRKADSDPLMRQILTPAFVDNLIVVANLELAAFETTVTDLERRRCYERV